MAIIAVAGGTSQALGRCIVSAILASTNTPIILSRKKSSNEDQPGHCHGAEVRYVDYTSMTSLATALKGVETVICVLLVPGPEAIDFQVNLLNAAREVGVKRFAPSEWELGPLASGLVDATAYKATVWEACEESGLECARFCNGMFMNYLALGAEKEKDMAQNFKDPPTIWNHSTCTAELPVKDDGTFPRITMSELSNIGQFVAAACELPLGSWKPTMGISGDEIGVDEVLQLLEQKSGKKWEATSVGRAELQQRVHSIQGIGNTMEDIYNKIIAQIELIDLEERAGMSLIDPTVNQLCPQVKPVTVKEFVNKLYA